MPPWHIENNVFNVNQWKSEGIGSILSCLINTLETTMHQVGPMQTLKMNFHIWNGTLMQLLSYRRHLVLIMGVLVWCITHIVYTHDGVHCNVQEMHPAKQLMLQKHAQEDWPFCKHLNTQAANFDVHGAVTEMRLRNMPIHDIRIWLLIMGSHDDDTAQSTVDRGYQITNDDG